MLKYKTVKMKTIKRVAVCFVSAVVATATLSAQNSLRFRAEAGLGASLMVMNNTSELIKDASKPDIDYRLAFGVDLPFANLLYLNTGLTYAVKGGKFEDNRISWLAKNGKIDVRTRYLQLPVNVGVRLGLGNLLALSLQAGPYFGLAVAGNAKFTSIFDNKYSIDLYKEHSEEELRALGFLAKRVLKENESLANRFDVGVGASAIMDVLGFYVKLGFEYGFLNSVNKDSFRDEFRVLYGRKDGLEANNFSGHFALGLRF